MKEVKELLEKLKIKPLNIDLFESAFTHISYKNEHSNYPYSDYDRLEFMGDAVLGFVVARLLFDAHPNKDSGSLTKKRSSLVKGLALSSKAREMNFQNYIKMSGSVDVPHSIDRILEDVFEAFIGAYYLNFGDEAVFKFIKKIFGEDIIKFNEAELMDYKSRLQIEIQKETTSQIQYVLTSESGTAQDKNFEMSCVLDGIILGMGSGSSKKKAEQDAARNALEKRVK